MNHSAPRCALQGVQEHKNVKFPLADKGVFFFCSGKSKNKTYAVELEFNGNIIPEVSFISEKLLMSDYFCVVLSMRRVFLHYYCLNNFFDISKLF